MSDGIVVGAQVKLAYRLLDGQGQLLEERTPEDPLVYTQGQKQILPALERALLGQQEGYEAKLRVAPQDGYGEYDESLVAQMPIEQFPDDLDVVVGMKFNTQGPQGQDLVVRIVEVADDLVTVDGNHPLAGLELIFEFKILEVSNTPPSHLPSGETLH